MPQTYLSNSSTTWTRRLAHILQTPSYNIQSTANRPILRANRHPSGEIWKHIFSICVYSELGESTSSFAWRKSRRFVRLEHFGLSGIILYEIPATRGIDGRIRPSYTLEEVFGSEECDYNDGISIIGLLDATEAKLVYFPAYACTSFVIGQVMQAFFTGKRDILPHSTRHGFCVYSTTPGHPESSEDDQPRISLDDEGSTASDSDPELLDHKCDRSVDSFGPQTPPRLESPLIQHYDVQKRKSSLLNVDPQSESDE